MNNILVTGASKGIGKAIAQDLSDLGNLYVTGRNELALKNFNAKDYLVCDLKTEVEKLGEFIIKNDINILINNAGEYIYGEIEKMSKMDIESIFKTNIESPTYLITQAVKNMKRERWGRIINIGSISGVMGEANASLYSATKAGLIGLTRALALELAEYNITVNTINPGWVDTELGNKSIEDSEFTKEEILDCIPQRRFVKPYEIAKLTRYLISEDAKGITGQSINLCAGLSVGI